VDAGADDDDVVAGLQVVGTPHALARHGLLVWGSPL
jgi:hypothetical protein